MKSVRSAPVGLVFEQEPGHGEDAGMPLITVDGLPSLNLVGRYRYDVVVLLAARDKNISAVLRLVLQPM